MSQSTTTRARAAAGYRRRICVIALARATGMGGGRAWVQPARAEREPLTLEAVKLAVELGVDVNAANTDGRTALDGAQALKYESVVAYLVEHGAKASGKPAPPVRVPN